MVQRRVHSIVKLLWSVLFVLVPISARAEPLELRPFLPDAPFCAESAHSFDVRHYQIDLDVPMDSARLSGHVGLTFTSRRPTLDSFSLMMDSLTCDSVKHNGIALAFTRPTGYLDITLDAPLAQGESTTVEIWYRRRTGIANRGFFFIPGANPQVYSVAAPYDARFWFPCYDEPFDKAEQGCDVNVTVPSAFSVCANGLLDSVRTDTAGQRKTFFWNHRYPIATYLIVFAASNWWEYDQWYHRGLSDSVIVRTYAQPLDSVFVKDNLRNVPNMLAFFCDTAMFGPYPFERYGHVYASGFQYGGMENQTLTMLAMYQPENTVSHEMSHMWWGDMVTCVDYRNVWLNEGFATYWEALYSEHAAGRNNFLNEMRANANSYFSADARRRFPTYAPPIAEVYNYGTIYCKGAWLQHMLRYLENDTVSAAPGVFFRALRAYGDSFKYGSASSEDWQRIQEQFTGLDLSTFFDEWLYQAGYPQYRLLWSVESIGPNFRIATNLSQNNGSNAPACFHMPVQLKLRRTRPDIVESLVVVPVAGNPQLDTFSLSFRPDTIIFDPGQWILKKVTRVSAVDESYIAGPDPELAIIGPTLAGQNIRFTCSLPGPGQLLIYDAGGRRVSCQAVPGGTTQQLIGSSRLLAGVYIVRLAMRRASATRKLILTR